MRHMRRVVHLVAALGIVSVGFAGGFAGESRDTFPALDAESADVRFRVLPRLLAERVSLALRPSSAIAQGEKTLSPVETYLSVRDTILTQHANPPADPKVAKDWPRKLQDLAIKGMVGSVGDVYTEYWTPDEFRKQMETTNGNFYGVGARLDVRDHKPLIVEPIPGTPAFLKGILPGDQILAVDGKSAILSKDQTLEDVIKRIKGPEGTQVTLTIERKGRKPFDVVLRRALVVSPVIESWMQDNERKIGYIRLDQFTEKADEQFAAALAKLEAQGMKALVFDLRGNPGGLLNIAQSLASRFIQSGPVVWTKQKQGEMESLDVDASKHVGKLSKGTIPVVVLVNGGSASASEIVSGAIQDAGVGFLVGTRTFGKGLVQTILPLGERTGALKITTQHYYTRDKHDINLKRDEDGAPIGGSGGIRPDKIVTEGEKDVEAQRKVLRENPGNRRMALQYSPQMKEAVQLLRDRLEGKEWPATQRNDPEKQDAAAKKDDNG